MPNKNINNKEESKTIQLTEEQLKKNQKKLDEYDRILKIMAASIGVMFSIIVCIVFALVVNNT